MEPPSYEESVDSNDVKRPFPDDSKSGNLQHLNLCDEVNLSRTQHVAALVERLLPQLRERARSGLSRSPLLILPSDQEKLSSTGELVGFTEDVVVIQLQGRYDGTAFWTQREALELLRERLYVAIAGEAPPARMPPVQPLPPRPVAEKSSGRSSWFGRKGKAPVVQQQVPEPAPVRRKPAVVVDVKLEEAHFRSENEYGLYQTLRGPAIAVTVEIP